MEIDIDLSALDIQSNESESQNTSLESENKPGEADKVRRSGRVKIRPPENIEKRRVVTRPRKLNINSSTKDIEGYYLDKKLKSSPATLETIFEEPKKDVLMGTRKLKRCIHFNDIVSEKSDKAKVKKRSMKAKKLNGFKISRKKVRLELLMNKLKDLDNDDS